MVSSQTVLIFGLIALVINTVGYFLGLSTLHFLMILGLALVYLIYGYKNSQILEKQTILFDILVEINKLKKKGKKHGKT